MAANDCLLDEHAARAAAAREVKRTLDLLYLKTADASLVTADAPEFLSRLDGRFGASGNNLSAPAQCRQ